MPSRLANRRRPSLSLPVAVRPVVEAGTPSARLCLWEQQRCRDSPPTPAVPTDVPVPSIRRAQHAGETRGKLQRRVSSDSS
ncbi:unnamed protein product [Cuscuta campestris]|uniref:Uncharacterized protein n=1 Tax=Cuscuta campestris TaxID=132261 RepID=A0A484NNN5_9ASTE|nr:unnamed protein product [Cuscuta campestris]